MRHLLAMFLIICTPVMADVYVVTAPDKTVYSISDQNDAVVPSGYSVTMLKGTIADLALSRPQDEYTFQGGKFKVDAAKVKAKEDAQLKEDQKKAAVVAARSSAVEKLKVLGLTEDEISALTGR